MEAELATVGFFKMASYQSQIVKIQAPVQVAHMADITEVSLSDAIQCLQVNRKTSICCPGHHRAPGVI